MGFSILGVMLAHIITIGNYSSNRVVWALEVFSLLTFTPCFLFLSGIGMYNSFSRNNDIKHFYIKRLKRVYVPFLFIAFPYFFFFDIVVNEHLLECVEHITTLSFWIDGNYSGMWYISVILALYLIYPFMHKIIFRKKKSVILTSVYAISIYVLSRISIELFFPNYYKNLSIGLTKLPMFIVGVVCMHYINKDKKWFSIKHFFILASLWVIFRLISKHFVYLHPEYVLCKYFITISFVTLCLHSIKGINFFSWFDKLLNFFGKYSLEMYIIHLLLFYTLDYFYGVEYSERRLIIFAVMISIIVSPFINRIISKLTSYF